MRKILIVDDIETNRFMLKNILNKEYDIIEAENGKDALRLMHRSYKMLSAILLDIVMPVMDGYEVLRQMRDNVVLSQIPVIVITGVEDETARVKALSLGANDYITKPYNPEVICHCVRNNISLRETASIVNAIQRDKLTGVYRREAFFEKVSEFLRGTKSDAYVLVCFDIDNFKLINDQYGATEGDRILKHIGMEIKNTFHQIGGICGRISGDNFAGIYPNTTEAASFLDNSCNLNFVPLDTNINMTISVGRYIISDLSLPVSAMYDRAYIAKRSVKGMYDRHVAVFDVSMLDHLVQEQQIISEMSKALETDQFEVWFQPQMNHSTGALIGAEALVRWRHPQRDIISPGIFIPIFEQNGFIYELDKYVWEQVCKLLRRWIDEGRNPLPVSVNISRYDVFRDDFIDVLNGLVLQYNIPIHLLCLEITESAFANSTKHIIEVVRRLREIGYVIEIDDFGSGYSSLNTLKDVPANILKLDMKFLEDDGDSQRGGNIVESVVRMAKWLGMAVLAEGVEEKEQADFLKSIGCVYIQGYLYSKPMPAEQYEEFAKIYSKEEKMIVLETVENLDNNSFWNPNSMDTLIFNSFVGGACIFEFREDKIELLRTTEKFSEILGGTEMTVETALKLDWEKCLSKDSYRKMLRAIKHSIKTGEEYTEEFIFFNLPGCAQKVYLRSTIRVIASAGERYLVYSTSENITAQRLSEQKERKIAAQMQAIMDNVESGITAVVLKKKPRILFANDQYYAILGYTREQFSEEVASVYDTVYFEDLEQVQSNLKAAGESEESLTMEFRAVRRDKSIVWVNTKLSVAHFPGIKDSVQLTIYTDITKRILIEQQQRQLLDNLPCGAALFFYDGTTLKIVHLNKRYCELAGRQNAKKDLSALDAIHPGDRKLVEMELKAAIRQERDAACDIRIQNDNGTYRPFHIIGNIMQRETNSYYVCATYTPISDETMSIQEMLPIALDAMMSSSTDFSYVKDTDFRYVCCSRSFLQMLDLKDLKDIVGKTDNELFAQTLAKQFMTEDKTILQGEKTIINIVQQIQSKEGQLRYVSTSKYPLRNFNGKTIGLYGVSRDVTKAVQNESRLKLLTDNIPGGIAVYEGKPDELDNIKLTYFSDGFCGMFGYRREEYITLSIKNPFGLVFKEDLHILTEAIYALTSDNQPVDCVYRARIKDGSYKWIHVKAVLGEKRGENHTVNAVLFDVTRQQEVIEQLRISEETNRLAMQHTGHKICRYNVSTRVLMLPEISPIFLMQEKLENVPYEPVNRQEISPDTAKAYIQLYEDIMHGKKEGHAIYQRISTNGWRWVEAYYTTIFSGTGDPDSAVISFSDITEQMDKEAVFKKWQQFLQDKAADTFTLFRCNLHKDTTLDSMEGSLLRVRFKESDMTFDQRTVTYATQFVYEKDRNQYFSVLKLDTLLADYYRGKRSKVIEYREKQPDGNLRWLRLTIDLVEYPNSTDVEAYLMYENIDEDKKHELMALEMAQIDVLTGVLNRAAFEKKVDECIKRNPISAQHALLMIDINGFKLVNDAFGHDTGDQALSEIANQIRFALREEDLLGRLGGAEFVVFISNIMNDSVVANVAQKICLLTRKSFSAEVQIYASIGISVSSRDGMTFFDLYKKADTALYYVKSSEKDDYAFYRDNIRRENIKTEGNIEQGILPLTNGLKRRMLIVDDSEIDVDLMANVFKDDFIIDKVSDGDTALIRMRHYGTAISVVLLDLYMPGTDGFDVLKQMRQSSEMQSIPVVVVSGSEQSEIGLKAIRNGASDFVTKPFDSELLRIRVFSAVSKGENDRLRSQNEYLELRKNELDKYRTVLNHNGIAVIENDWVRKTFSYDADVSATLAGIYDGRTLWRILLSDMVTDTATVQKIQGTLQKMAEDRECMEKSIYVQMKNPSRIKHWFNLTIYKKVNEFGLTDKLILTFTDQGLEMPEIKP